MNFTQEQATAILKKMELITDEIGSPCILVLASKNQSLMATSKDSKNINDMQDVFCSANAVLIKLIKK